MITVPEATQTIIKRSRYLTEAMSKGIINNSSLARYIKPEIEKMLLKKVSSSSIIMALNRLSHKFKPKYFSGNIFKTPPQIIIHFNLESEEIENLKVQDFAPKNLSSMTIKLPKKAIKTPGVLYFFIKSLAWEGINIVKAETGDLEIILMFEKKDINNAFNIIQSLFKEIV